MISSNPPMEYRVYSMLSLVLLIVFGLLSFPTIVNASSTLELVQPDTLPSNCYAVSDLGNPDKLFAYDTLTDMWAQVGSTGVNGIEGIALNPIDQKLNAVDQNVFGYIDLMTGAFMTIGPALGTADGSLGNITISDVERLSYDPYLNTFYKQWGCI